MIVKVYNYYLECGETYRNVTKITEYTFGGFKLLFENGDEKCFDADWDFSIDNLR